MRGEQVYFRRNFEYFARKIYIIKDGKMKNNAHSDIFWLWLSKIIFLKSDTDLNQNVTKCNKIIKSIVLT